MSNNEHTTTSASAATFDPFAFAERLYDLQMLTRAASTVADAAINDACSLQGLVAITKHEAELISFFAHHLEARAKAANAAFDVAAVGKTPDAATTPTGMPGRAETIPEAIQRHRNAFTALRPLYEAVDSASSDATKAALEAGEEQEQIAKRVLMRARPANLAEEADRLEYLFSRVGPWHGFAPTFEEGADLVASLRAA